MSDETIIRLVFGGLACAFGAWLFPKWRREKKRNADRNRSKGPIGLFGGRLAPRQVWLWMNTWGSLAIGLPIFIAGISSARDDLARERERRMRNEIGVQCRAWSIEVANRAAEPRWVSIDEAAVLDQAMFLGQPERRHTLDTSQAKTPVAIAPGASHAFKVALVDAGACPAVRIALQFGGDTRCSAITARLIVASSEGGAERFTASYQCSLPPPGAR